MHLGSLTLRRAEILQQRKTIFAAEIDEFDVLNTRREVDACMHSSSVQIGGVTITTESSTNTCAQPLTNNVEIKF